MAPCQRALVCLAMAFAFAPAVIAVRMHESKDEIANVKYFFNCIRHTIKQTVTELVGKDPQLLFINPWRRGRYHPDGNATPLEVAIHDDQQWNSVNMTPILLDVCLQHLGRERVKELVNMRGNISGSLPLGLAAGLGYEFKFSQAANAVKLLLRHGADVTGQDDEGNTALHWAAERGNANCVEVLLEHSETAGVQWGLLTATNEAGLTAIEVCKAERKRRGVDIRQSGATMFDECEIRLKAA